MATFRVLIVTDGATRTTQHGLVIGAGDLEQHLNSAGDDGFDVVAAVPIAQGALVIMRNGQERRT